MKRITLGVLAVLLFSTVGTTYVSAKSSSGGGVPVESTPAPAPAPTPAPTPAPAPTPTPSAPATAPTPAPTPSAPSPSTPTPASTSVAPTSTTKTEEVVVCSTLETLEERVKCRVEKTEDEFAIELTEENYNPEGCRWGTEEWQEKCKARYQTIHDLYSLPLGEERMLAIKESLGLPENLVEPSIVCDGENSAATEECTQEYKDKIVHLVVARFYDVEQRAEELNAEGKITDEQLIDFVVKVSEAKVAMYDAKNQSNPNETRLEIVTNLQADWNALVKDL